MKGHHPGRMPEHSFHSIGVIMNPELIKRISIKTESKIFHLVIDGLGGLPHPESGLTELETAKTPYLDQLAAEGNQGLATPIDYGITPGSGPAHLALFGYDPWQYQVGRGILDISGVNFDFKEGDVAARVNFCTIDEDGLITDRRAGRIPDEEGKRICEKLQKQIRIDGIETKILHTKEYRAGIVLRKSSGGLKGNILDTDPQDVGKAPLPAVARDDESKESAELFNQLIAQAREILADEAKANMLLVRGMDDYKPMPSFGDLFNLTPLCIAAYPMYRGVARLVGMDLADLNSTATISDQFSYLEKEWGSGDQHKYDYVFFHVKKTDSAGEDGDFDKKVHVLEELDENIPRLLALQPNVIIVTGDHSTPSLMKSHSWHPLPTIVHSDKCRRDPAVAFGETEALKGALGQFPATEIMPLALAHAGKLLKFGA